MKFEKIYWFDEPYWISGIYKISRYTYFRGNECKPYYHAYFIQPWAKNWGDYVGGKPVQDDKRFTFQQANQLCIEHAKTYKPNAYQLAQAEKSKLAMAEAA